MFATQCFAHGAQAISPTMRGRISTCPGFDASDGVRIER